jgi:hypothetical protein
MMAASPRECLYTTVSVCALIYYYYHTEIKLTCVANLLLQPLAQASFCLGAFKVQKKEEQNHFFLLGTDISVLVIRDLQM